MRRSRFAPALTALAVLAFVNVSGAALAADPAPAATTPAAAPAAPTDDAAARALLLGMAKFMASAPGLKVTMRSGYDAIQADGQRIEFGERRQILLSRPGGLKVEVERSDGERGSVVFDGNWITAYNATENVYARVQKPGTVDDALVYMVRDLQATLPLARMFTTRFGTEMDRLATSVTLVEDYSLFDVPTSHLAVRAKDVDVQLWIAKGPQPLPRRVIITYKNAEGEPQYRADLYDWSVAPKADAAAFKFVPPAGAQQITYLAPRPAANKAAAPDGDLK